MSFDCCRHCVAPKRHPGCHATCPEYPIAKEEYNKKMKYLDHTDADRVLYATAADSADRLIKDKKKWTQSRKKRI